MFSMIIRIIYVFLLRTLNRSFCLIFQCLVNVTHLPFQFLRCIRAIFERPLNNYLCISINEWNYFSLFYAEYFPSALGTNNINIVYGLYSITLLVQSKAHYELYARIYPVECSASRAIVNCKCSMLSHAFKI